MICRGLRLAVAACQGVVAIVKDYRDVWRELRFYEQHRKDPVRRSATLDDPN